MRNLEENSRAIASLRIAAACAAVRQVDENLYAFENDLVRFLAFDVGYETDAAGIALIRGVVKPLRCR